MSGKISSFLEAFKFDNAREENLKIAKLNSESNRAPRAGSDL